MKKIITTLLSAMLVFSSSFLVKADGNVAETGGVEYTSIQEAIDNCANLGTINLLTDVNNSFTIPSGKTVNIYLSGHTITNTEGEHTIINNGGLNLFGNGTVDNTSHKKAALVNMVGATATLNDAVKLTRSKEDSSSNSYYVIRNYGTMQINGAEVVSESVLSSMIANGWYGSSDLDAYTSTKAVLTINDGKFVSDKTAVKNDDYSELIINGGNFVTGEKTGKEPKVAIQNHGTATINGGYFEADRTIQDHGCDKNNDPGVLTITGGTFKGTEFVIHSWAVFDNVNVSGGTFEGNISKEIADTTFTIEGGTYTVNVKDFLKDGSVEYSDNTTTYTVGTNESLQTLINNSTKGTTVKVYAGTASVNLDSTNGGVSVENDGATLTVDGKEVKNGEKTTSLETVTTPTVSLKDGTYYSAQTLKFADETEGATIYIEIVKNDVVEYTGVAKDYELTSEVGESNSYNLTAYATKEGMKDSEKLTGVYTVVVTDKTTLSKLVETNEKKYTDEELAEYTTFSVENYKEKLTNAKTILEKVNASQEEIDKAVDDLKDAVSKLTKEGTVVTPTVDVPAGTYYTEQTLKFFVDTEDAVIYIEVFKNGEREYKGEAKDYILTSKVGDSNAYTIRTYAVKDGMKNSAITEYKYTIAIPDKDALKELIKTYEAKYTSTELAKYTDLTVKAYNEKLASAKEIVEKTNVSQSELSNAASQLTSAVNNLKLKTTTNTKTDTSTNKTNNSTYKTCEEQGKVWSENKKMCVYVVSNTSAK